MQAQPIESTQFRAYVLIWCAVLVYGLQLIWMDYENNDIGQTFMHNINLMFHEAGHPIFGLFGKFMGALGGSLMQLLVPAVVAFALLWQNRDPFGASIGLWWLAESLMDLAPYIGDSQALQLTLLGGGTGADRPGMHDWHNILGALGLLDYDHSLAWVVDVSGELLMLVALAWGGLVLWQQYQLGNRPKEE